MCAVPERECKEMGREGEQSVRKNDWQITSREALAYKCYMNPHEFITTDLDLDYVSLVFYALWRKRKRERELAQREILFYAHLF